LIHLPSPLTFTSRESLQTLKSWNIFTAKYAPLPAPADKKLRTYTTTVRCLTAEHTS
jgi:hypothetical protein